MRDDDVVAFGFRDADEQVEYGSQPLPPGLRAVDLPSIRSLGLDVAAREAVAHLTRASGPDRGFWIHLDADVLDDAIMPAVDYRLPGGLSWKELTAVLRVAIESRRAVGLDVTIYNPTLDPRGEGARGLVSAVADAFA